MSSISPWPRTLRIIQTRRICLMFKLHWDWIPKGGENYEVVTQYTMLSVRSVSACCAFIFCFNITAMLDQVFHVCLNDMCLFLPGWLYTISQPTCISPWWTCKEKWPENWWESIIFMHPCSGGLLILSLFEYFLLFLLQILITTWPSKFILWLPDCVTLLRAQILLVWLNASVSLMEMFYRQRWYVLSKQWFLFLFQGWTPVGTDVLPATTMMKMMLFWVVSKSQMKRDSWNVTVWRWNAQIARERSSLILLLLAWYLIFVFTRTVLCCRQQIKRKSMWWIWCLWQDDPLDKCPNPQCSYVPSHHANSIRITLIDAIREHIDKYYEVSSTFSIWLYNNDIEIII